MRILIVAVVLESLLIVAVGLWRHDLVTVAAAIAVVAIIPLLREQPERPRRRHPVGCICPECQQRGARERLRRGA